MHADAPKPERGTCVCARARVCYVQRLGLLKTLMLAWQRQRTMDAGGVRHTGALMMVALLPSRLLAIIGREVLKLPLEARCRQPAGIWHAPTHSVPSSPSQPKCEARKPQAWHSQHILVAVSLWRVSAACTVCRSSHFLLM